MLEFENHFWRVTSLFKSWTQNRNPKTEICNPLGMGAHLDQQMMNSDQRGGKLKTQKIMLSQKSKKKEFQFFPRLKKGQGKWGRKRLFEFSSFSIKCAFYDVIMKNSSS